MSSTMASTPRALRPALVPLVATHPHQSRSIWLSARHRRDAYEKMHRISRRIDKYQRHPLANLRRRPENRYESPSISLHRHPGWNWGWKWWRSRSSFSDLSSGRGHKSWDAEMEQMQQRMEQLKKRIEADPYGAIFGRRLEPFHPLDRFENACSGFLRSFMNADKPTGPKAMGSAPWQMGGGESPLKNGSSHMDFPSRRLPQDFNFRQADPSTTHYSPDALEYDPISGRMAPKPPKPVMPSSGKVGAPEKVVDCPPGSEIEAKFVSNPSLIEDGQFQPGNAVSQVPVPKSSTEAGVDDCPPGNELETNFRSNPASFQELQTRPEPPAEKDTPNKPNITIACPPGNELEAKFISESVRSEDEQPRLGTFKVQETSKELDADAGLSSRVNAECPPGSELEAKFISDPASRLDSTLPPQEFGGESSNITVDCPPGNELDAKFISEGAPSETISSEVGTGCRPSVDCSPGSELEAKLAESINVKAETSSIDCPPGNELEAKFISDPSSAEDGQFQPGLLADHGNVKKSNVSVDCAPGHELEAMFISGSAKDNSGQHVSENLDTMSASDIRARYATEPTLEAQAHPARTNKNLEFDGSEDRVGDFLTQSAKLANDTSASPTAPAWSSGAYRILAYDSSALQMTTAEADSFFGTEETTQPAEVLARLHNPAKFVPYFAQMQQDGYEISTGGGDILVFRKAHGTSGHTPSASTVQDSDNAEAHAKIAKSIRHDSIDPAEDSTASSNNTFTPSPNRVVSRQETVFTGGPPNWSPYPPSSASNLSTPETELPSHHKSSFRKAFRRMVFAGTATAGTCYAFGAVTEYFRTGGKDGRGIDGFTVFESDRRRRE